MSDVSSTILPVPSARGRSLGDTLGQKRYELSNHLGNVLAVISDKRLVVGCTTYAAELHQATDYYPYGALWSIESVRDFVAHINEWPDMASATLGQKDVS